MRESIVFAKTRPFCKISEVFGHIYIRGSKGRASPLITNSFLEIRVRLTPRLLTFVII